MGAGRQDLQRVDKGILGGAIRGREAQRSVGGAAPFALPRQQQVRDKSPSR